MAAVVVEASVAVVVAEMAFHREGAAVAAAADSDRARNYCCHPASPPWDCLPKNPWQLKFSSTIKRIATPKVPKGVLEDGNEFGSIQRFNSIRFDSIPNRKSYPSLSKVFETRTNRSYSYSCDVLT